MLDRDSSIALHEQLRRLLQEDIVSGRLVPGDRLPTEREFCERYDVSRITVTRALSDLERLNLIERRQGSGSVVAAGRVQRSFDRVRGLTESLASQGHATHSTILGFERVVADDVPADLRDLVEDCPPRFMRLRRLRFVGAQPGVLATSFIPWTIGSQINPHELESGSLYAAFEAILGAPVVRNEQITSLILASQEIARHFKVKMRSAHFLFRGSAHAEGNRLVELTHSIFRGDLFEFRASMRRASVRKGIEALA